MDYIKFYMAGDGLSTKYIPVTKDWVFYHEYFKWDISYVGGLFHNKVMKADLAVNYKMAINVSTRQVFWWSAEEVSCFETQQYEKIPHHIKSEMTNYFYKCLLDALPNVPPETIKCVRQEFTTTSYCAC